MFSSYSTQVSESARLPVSFCLDWAGSWDLTLVPKAPASLAPFAGRGALPRRLALNSDRTLSDLASETVSMSSFDTAWQSCLAC